MKSNQSFTELIKDAIALFEDQPEDIRKLIYWAVKLDDEERAALIMAYQTLYLEKE